MVIDFVDQVFVIEFYQIALNLFRTPIIPTQSKQTKKGLKHKNMIKYGQ
jgi:hypothetical protein